MNLNANIDKANCLLDGGGTLNEALLAAGLESEIRPCFSNLTKESEVVIPYWRDRGRPNARVIRINIDKTVFLYGDEKNPKGGYGMNVSLDELAQLYSFQSK